MNTRSGGINFTVHINVRELGVGVQFRRDAFRYGGTFLAVIVGPVWLQWHVNY